MTATAPIKTTTAAPQTTGSWLTETLRLARWTLFLARRRLMSKVLVAILLAGFALVLLGSILTYVAISSTEPQARSCPPPAIQTQAARQNGGSLECATIPPEALAQERQQWQQEVNRLRDQLGFPVSLGRTGSYTSFMGVLLACILAATVIGGEYGAGTLRLAISRGVGRGQLVAAQSLALAVIALVVAGGMLVLGALAGLVVGPLVGAHPPAIGANGWVEIGVYWLALALNIYIFELVALYFATLGRSVAAGIGAGLGYLVGESIVSAILMAVSQGVPGAFGEFLGHIPEWLLGINAGAIWVNVSQSPVDLGISTSTTLVKLTTGHAVGVTLAYCAVLIGFTYLLVRARDITD